MKNNITINGITYELVDCEKTPETSYECYDYCALNQVCNRLVKEYELRPCIELFLTDSSKPKYFKIVNYGNS